MAKKPKNKLMYKQYSQHKFKRVASTVASVLRKKGNKAKVVLVFTKPNGKGKRWVVYKSK